MSTRVVTLAAILLLFPLLQRRMSLSAAAKKDSIDVDSGDDDSDDDDFTDGTNGGIDMEKMFPNKPGELGVEFTYVRDATGRVVSVSARPIVARVKNKKGVRSNGDEDDE